MDNVAVLIPTFKPGSYLEKCFLSLEKQTLSKNRFCVYIALNGPKENYENYILNYLLNMTFLYRFIYLKDPGVSNARNKLMEYSNEKFIVFIDDDDLISENYLENLLNESSNKYMGVCNIYNFEKDLNNLKKNYIGKSYDKLSHIETSKFKIRKYFSSPVAKMIHRDMVENFTFDVQVSKGEDSLFMATISKNIFGIKKTSSDTIYYVYERIGSTTRKKDNFNKEIRTIAYLEYKYIKLLFNKNYEKLFVLTRIIATIIRLLKIIKQELK